MALRCSPLRIRHPLRLKVGNACFPSSTAAGAIPTEVTLKMKMFPLYFLPVALLRRNRPPVIFSLEFR